MTFNSVFQYLLAKGVTLSQTYQKAGVDIDAGERLVRHIKTAVRSTFSPSVIGGIGSFGAFFDAKFKGYRSPVLVSSVDGVGTKLKIAQMVGKHDTVGQDLVNHCVNDILVCGAKPLYFLDYFATGKLDVEVARDVIDGFVKACKENECSLIGGETAEMPGFYDEDEYDLAGMIVGVVEKKKILTGKKIKAGDVLIGLPSTGLHTNGFSLARAVLLSKFSIDEKVDDLGSTLAEALLAVHRSYLKTVNAVLKNVGVHGLSHITGGGIVGNTMRIMPKGLKLAIDWNAWGRPPIFALVQKTGDVPEEDMRRAFNLGVGLVMIVAARDADAVLAVLKKRKEKWMMMGDVVREK
ncbi:MAG: phosphoribosylformylglycinamidine cyclo-ligase [Ignavibacteriae bacterium]|nr:phosphoribosylformylglycinamidine cyclo-ligase [Ignavibacteriota bacterium]